MRPILGGPLFARLLLSLGLVACSSGASPIDAGTDTTAPRDIGPVDSALDVARDASQTDAASDVANCPDGRARCGDACFDLSTESMHCGACGRVCALQGAVATCASGRCAVRACAAGRGDCDGDSTNGCEVDTAVNLAHCGACGRACAPPNAVGACVGGLCRPACRSGFGDCDGDSTNGCEVDTRVSDAHCGACGRACVAPSGGAVACRGGTCELSCAAGFCAMGGRCVAGASAAAPPRPVAPLSTSTVTSRRPTLLWELPSGVEGARVEFCLDRACARPVTAFDAVGAEGRPGVDLPVGVLFWRLRGRASGCTGAVAGPTWQFVVPHRSSGVDSSWGAIPDVNGDGYADLIVGARGGVRPPWQSVGRLDLRNDACRPVGRDELRSLARRGR